MKKVNFRKVFTPVLLVAVLLIAGSEMTSAQSTWNGSGGTGATKQPSFVSTSLALQKLQPKLPILLNQLNALQPDSEDYKKKDAEALYYKEIISDLNQGKSVASAYDTATERLKAKFNLGSSADQTQFRNIQKQVYNLLTNP